MIIDGWSFERIGEKVYISEAGFKPYERVEEAFKTKDPNDSEFWEGLWSWYVPIAKKASSRAIEKFYKKEKNDELP